MTITTTDLSNPMIIIMDLTKPTITTTDTITMTITTVMTTTAWMIGFGRCPFVTSYRQLPQVAEVMVKNATKQDRIVTIMGKTVTRMGKTATRMGKKTIRWADGSPEDHLVSALFHRRLALDILLLISHVRMVSTGYPQQRQIKVGQKPDDHDDDLPFCDEIMAYKGASMSMMSYKGGMSMMAYMGARSKMYKGMSGMKMSSMKMSHRERYTKGQVSKGKGMGMTYHKGGYYRL